MELLNSQTIHEFIQKFLSFHSFHSLEILENKNSLGCMSVFWSVKVHSISKEKNILIKQMIPSLKMFHELETYFYKEILPAISFKSLFPKFFFANKNFIAMEDLTEKGWFSLHPSKGLNYQEAKIALETLACFHSEGYKIRAQHNYALMRNIFPKLLDVKKHNTTHAIEKNPYFQQGFNLVVSKLSNQIIICSILALEKKIKYYLPWLLHQVDKFFASETLLHNDAHKNNFLFRKNKSKLVDFQMMTNGHPSRDVMMLLLSSLENLNDLDFLVEFYLERLKFYCDPSGQPPAGKNLTFIYEKTKSNWKTVCAFSSVLAIITIIISAQNMFIKNGAIQRLENILSYAVEQKWI